MSPEESVPTLDLEAPPATKPKAVRRRRVTTPDAEQPTLLADVAAPTAPAGDGATTGKPKRAPRRVVAKKVAETDAPADVNGAAPTTAPPRRAARSPRPVSISVEAPVSTPSTLPQDKAPETTPSREFSSPTPTDSEPQNTPVQSEEKPFNDAPQSRDNEFNSRADTEGSERNPSFGENGGRGDISRDNAPRFDNRGDNRNENRGGRFAGRDNFPRDNAPQNADNGAPSLENRAPNGQPDNQNGGENGEGERNFDNRLRFRNDRDRSRNQLRRERNQNRNGRFDRPLGEGNFNPQPYQPRRREVEILGLQALERPDLEAVAAEFNVENLPEENDALIYAILEAQAHSQNAILKRGTLEILGDGKGFLRCEGYLPADGDVYVSQSQIKRFNLKTGDLVLGTVRTPKEMERFHGLLRVEAINGLSPEVMKTRKDFEKLTPIFPTEKFVLETEATNITARIIDLVSPIGKGSRGLIVAPPKAGKTTLIKNIANSIAKNHPEVKLIVLLIDERPEEVTDISRSTTAEVVASTFDEMPDNHMRVADIVMEKAKRLVEMKQDVVILMDSITRLSRASNLVVAPSGRTLSGGLDPAAMYRPKRMFGAARNIEEGGSLTILATALVDTGSRMDEMIFEEFKGTGNLDLVLDRNLFDQRIFPAIDINRSGTRRDDLLLGKEDLATIFHLRRTLAQLDNDKAVTLLIDRLKNTRSNLDFMGVVAKSARNTGQGAG